MGGRGLYGGKFEMMSYEGFYQENRDATTFAQTASCYDSNGSMSAFGNSINEYLPSLEEKADNLTQSTQAMLLGFLGVNEDNKKDTH